jgi:hypothetical protein
MDIQKPKVNVGGADTVSVTPKVVMQSNVPSAPIGSPEPAPVQTAAPSPVKPSKPGRPWKAWLLGVVVVLLAAGGAYGWQQYNLGTKITQLEEDLDIQKTKVRQAEESASTTTDAAKKAAEDAAKAATPAIQYQTIKEFGVKFVLSTPIKDLQYSADDKSAKFSTAALIKADSKGCAITSAPVGALVRYAKGQFPKEGASLPLLIGSIGNYDYGFQSPQATCYDPEKVKNGPAYPIRELKDSLFGTLQPA